MKIEFCLVLLCTLLYGCSISEHQNDFREKLALKTLDGNDVDISKMDEKYLLVNFWATWCKPCLREMPSLKELESSMNSEKIDFVFVSDEEPQHVAEFIKDKDLGIESYVMTNAVEVFSLMYLPTTYIVDPEGKVVFKQEGEEDWSSLAMKEKISDLIEL